MTAQEVYKGVLAELRKEETTSMTPEEFNYHAFIGQLEYVKTRYWGFDRHQKAIDDLQQLIVVTDGLFGNPLPLNNLGLSEPGQEGFALPYDSMTGEGYLYMLQGKASVIYKGHPCVSDASPGTVYLRYKQHNINTANVYDNQSEDYVHYYLESGYIRIEPGFPGHVSQLIIRYLRYPARILVDETTGESVSNPELNDMATLEVIKWITHSFLETIESYRLQTMEAIQGKVFVHQTNN